MTNSQLIAHMVASTSREIEHRMKGFGDTYAEARAKVKDQTCAGPAVWEKIDATFN
jgi:hypothetical protein